MNTVRAYVVFDVNGIAPFRPQHDVWPRYIAYGMARARNSTKFPLYPGSKWKAVPVEITQVRTGSERK